MKYIDDSSQNVTEDEQRTLSQMSRCVPLKTNVTTGSTHISPPRIITNERRNVGRKNKGRLETNANEADRYSTIAARPIQ